MITRDDVYQKVSSILVELFEVDPGAISEEALLYEELDIDSIDAVDLVIELKAYTGKKIAPEDFKSVRTVGDIVNAVYDILVND